MVKESFDNWFEEIRTKFTIEDWFDPAINGKNELYHDLNSFPPVVYRSDQEWTTRQLKEQSVDIIYYPSDFSFTPSNALCVSLEYTNW